MTFFRYSEDFNQQKRNKTNLNNDCEDSFGWILRVDAPKNFEEGDHSFRTYSL